MITKEIEKIDTCFDYILIDCPPSLGLLTLNALVACKNLLVPLQVEFYALEGLTQLMETGNQIKNNYNNSHCYFSCWVFLAWKNSLLYGRISFLWNCGGIF